MTEGTDLRAQAEALLEGGESRQAYRLFQEAILVDGARGNELSLWAAAESERLAFCRSAAEKHPKSFDTQCLWAVALVEFRRWETLFTHCATLERRFPEPRFLVRVRRFRFTGAARSPGESTRCHFVSDLLWLWDAPIPGHGLSRLRVGLTREIAGIAHPSAHAQIIEASQGASDPALSVFLSAKARELETLEALNLPASGDYEASD